MKNGSDRIKDPQQALRLGGLCGHAEDEARNNRGSHQPDDLRSNEKQERETDYRTQNLAHDPPGRYPHGDASSVHLLGTEPPERARPPIVSRRLGHSTVAFTLDVYSHVLPQVDAEAAELIAGTSLLAEW